MAHTNTHTRRPLILASALTAIVACLALAACGGSSSSSATSANAANTSSTSARGAAGNGFAAMRECLQKNGITLPQRPPGQRRTPGVGGLLGGGGAGGAGGPQLPKGVTRAQFQAAIQKCGGRAGRFVGPGGQSSRRRFGSPAFRTALTAFGTCMNNNGVKLPAPNTSGTGPVFNTQGIDTTSASFKAASTKCQSVLRNAFPRAPRTGSGQGAPGQGTAQ